MSPTLPIHVPEAPSPPLRLAPLAAEPSLLLRVFNWLLRRRLGKVFTASRVIYARLPALLWGHLPLFRLAEAGLMLSGELRHLVEVHVSTLNGCSFCEDLHRKSAQLTRVPEAKLRALAEPEASPALSERERIALRYVGEIARTGTASDATFERLRAAFSEREIVELTWLQAFTTYLNRMARPLGIGSDGFCTREPAGS